MCVSHGSHEGMLVDAQGVRVNAINPATVVTNFFTSAGMSADAAQAYMDKSAKTHPIGRVGVPADIAELCYFLTDNSKAGWITGQVSSTKFSQVLLWCPCLLRNLALLPPDRQQQAWLDHRPGEALHLSSGLLTEGEGPCCVCVGAGTRYSSSCCAHVCMQMSDL